MHLTSSVIAKCISSAVMVFAACSSSDDGVTPQDGADAAATSGSDAAAAASLGGVNPTPTAGDAQNPPTSNAAAVEAWLAQGTYKAWACETVAHAQMKVSPHGKNRICSNTVTASFTGKVGDERPIGSAAVKELYDDTDTLVGYAVYAKVKPTSDGGASWYWYERVPTTSMAPNTNGVVADGLGSEGRALSICVGCHAAAGTNDDHTVLGSSDFVYDQISR